MDKFMLLVISHLLIVVTIKNDKVAITHLAMEIHLQTTDHVVGAEKVPEQHIWTKYTVHAIVWQL